MNLPESLYTKLRDGLTCLLATTGEDGYPHIGFAWAAARDPQTVWFTVDLGSRTLANLQRTHQAALQFIAEGNLIFLVKGSVGIVRETLDAPPLTMCIWELMVEEVRDQRWAGVQVTPLGYRFEGRGAEKLQEAERKAIQAITQSG
jgi:hypothetical protein